MESTLIEIIRHFENYRAQIAGKNEEDNLTSFAIYLNAQLDLKREHGNKLEKDQWKKFSRDTLIEMAAAYLGKMGRFVDQYARKNMPSTPIENLDEFTYMILLLQVESITKSEIILRNVHPITTGTEILKRLAKKGYITEHTDESDKRKTRISLTEEGKGALYQSGETTKKLAYVATGALSDEELMNLVSTLKKLDLFHHQIHSEHKELNLDEIISTSPLLNHQNK